MQIKRFLMVGGLVAAFASAHAANLLQVYRQALLSAPSLKANHATYQAAVDAEGIGFATMLPTLKLQADAQTGRGNDAQGYHAYDVIATGTLDVLNLNDWGTYLTSKANEYAARATYRSQQQQFIVTVVTDYVNVRKAEDNLQLSESNQRYLQKTLEQSKQKYHVGLATKTDLSQAEADYYRAHATVIQDRNNVKIAEQKLEAITGKAYTQLDGVTSDYAFVAPDPAKMEVWVKRALEHNANLNAQRSTTSASYRSVVSAAGSQLPSVQLVGTWGRYDNNATGSNAAILGVGNHQTSGSIALQLTWNIFTGGSQFASSMQAVHNYEAQEATEEQTYRTTASQTRQDYLSVIADLSLIKAYEQSVKAGQSSLKQYQEEYHVGTETIVAVLNEVKKLFQAQVNLVNARYQYIVAMLNLELDAGTLSIESIKAINKGLGPVKSVVSSF